MSLSDSANLSVLFQDVDAPLFTQREIADVCGFGVSMKAISNWLDRGLIELEPLNGRPQTGRRLFSRRQLVTIDLVSHFLASGLALQDAFEVAKEAYTVAAAAYAAEKLLLPGAGKAKPREMWFVVARSVFYAVKGELNINWQSAAVYSPRDQMSFTNEDGTIFAPSGMNSYDPVLSLPIRKSLVGLAEHILEVLGTDFL